MKVIRNSKLIKIIRNFTGFKPALTILDLNKKNVSTSDAFFWRTDNDFKTIFKFTDIFSLFFKEQNSACEIFFYDKENNFIKKIKLSQLNLSNEITIDKNFMDQKEDYGTFYIFHYSKNDHKSIIRNSCYTGFSHKDNISYVHGNTITAYKNLNNDKLNFGIGGRTFFKNNIYQIQNSFKNKNVELMLMNPTKKKLKILVNDENFTLDSCCSIIKKFNNVDIIKILSKCYLLRPIIFSYDKNYFDVYNG